MSASNATSIAKNSKDGSDPVETMVFKLLNKAGRDPRLTPRILREKAEQRLSMTKGELKPQRNRIKDMIVEWDKKKRQEALVVQHSTLQALTKLAKATGNLRLFKGINGEANA